MLRPSELNMDNNNTTTPGNSVAIPPDLLAVSPVSFVIQEPPNKKKDGKRRHHVVELVAATGLVDKTNNSQIYHATTLNVSLLVFVSLVLWLVPLSSG